MNYFFKQYSVWLRHSSSAGRLCICCHEIRLFFTSREFYCLWRGVLELESMAVVFCFLFKTIQREKEREGLSNFCSLPFKGYANTSLLRGGGEIQGGCPHGLTSHSAYTFSFSFFFLICELYWRGALLWMLWSWITATVTPFAIEEVQQQSVANEEVCLIRGLLNYQSI